MKTIKKIITIVAIFAALGALLVVDAKAGESTCGEGNYNQTTGECIAK